MKHDSRSLALGGVMAALGAMFILLGGVIPAATFCAPALAGLALVPVFVEGGAKLALGAYAAIAALALILCPDKEAALLFAFLGWYPAVKWKLDAKMKPWPRRIVKFALWDGAALAMAAMIFFVLRMDEVIAEYREMGRAMAAAFALLANVTMALYDRLLAAILLLYVRKLRPKLFGGGSSGRRGL